MSNDDQKISKAKRVCWRYSNRRILGDDKAMESSSTTRRDFLKYVGFSTAAASLVACEGPVIHSVLYVTNQSVLLFLTSKTINMLPPLQMGMISQHKNSRGSSH
jgi:hypothetical protein